MAPEAKHDQLKPVQELLESGVVPEMYLQQLKDEHQVGDGPLPLMDGPIIDFSLLSSFNSEELSKLRSALSTWGCFQLVNHGMTSELLDEIRELSKEFFKLPLEEKEKTTLHEYSNKTKEVSKTLFKAMSRSLKLDENRFFELWGDDKEDIIHARFNFYPRCPSANQVVGLKAHTDGSAITVLLQDKEIEGLQVLKDDQWFKVPIIPEAIIIHVGDQLEIASNGIFKSPVHKVVINPKCDRISLAMLPLPNPEKEIGPLKELITEDRPQMFKRLKDYGQIYFTYMASMERQINAVKINY
uniref:Fe2OG dioxygenase domain-containing protein n=1 Tax=Chenopodium quinoa TaxID=63459 RepID=A0A803MXP8_CHEQI